VYFKFERQQNWILLFREDGVEEEATQMKPGHMYQTCTYTVVTWTIPNPKNPEDFWLFPNPTPQNNNQEFGGNDKYTKEFRLPKTENPNKFSLSRINAQQDSNIIVTQKDEVYKQ